ncbi:MAG TPA: hypothetical protein VMW95_03550, partial [Desulfobacterales bacterium]|nr:hypothetical protein [Desulfobacterales bacterium]
DTNEIDYSDSQPVQEEKSCNNVGNGLTYAQLENFANSFLSSNKQEENRIKLPTAKRAVCPDYGDGTEPELKSCLNCKFENKQSCEKTDIANGICENWQPKQPKQKEWVKAQILSGTYSDSEKETINIINNNAEGISQLMERVAKIENK